MLLQNPMVQMARSAGGNPIFNGTAWTITSNSVDIGNYFAETQIDGSGGTFEDFNIYKRRPICKLISCSGGEFQLVQNWMLCAG